LELETEEARRWAPFIDFKRRVDRRTVMSGRSIIKDMRPGRYNLGAMVAFSDLPPLLPRHATIRNCFWIDGDGSKPGMLTFPVDFDGKIPVDIATSETVGYYGAAIAESAPSAKTSVFLGRFATRYLHSYLDFGVNKFAKYDLQFN
jgi:hypothetical protein